MSARINRSGSPGSAPGITLHNSLSGVPSDLINVPSITPDVIQYLNLMFPDRLGLIAALGSVEAAKGARAVVEHLTAILKEQQNNDHVLR